MIYLGVDPGKAGGIAALDEDGVLLETYVMPVITAAKGRDVYDTEGMRRVVLEASCLGDYAQAARPGIDRRVFATVEKGQPMPKGMGGAYAQFHRGTSPALWEGLLVGMQVPRSFEPAQTWQRSMLAGIEGDTKQRALIAAQRLWPGQDWRASERSRKPHDGIVDAALIAEYGRRRRGGA